MISNASILPVCLLWPVADDVFKLLAALSVTVKICVYHQHNTKHSNSQLRKSELFFSFCIKHKTFSFGNFGRKMFRMKRKKRISRKITLHHHKIGQTTMKSKSKNKQTHFSKCMNWERARHMKNKNGCSWREDRIYMCYIIKLLDNCK